MLIAAIAAAIAIALGGCGSSGSAKLLPGALAHPTKATLILDFTPNAVHAGIYRALAAGYYRRENIELEYGSRRLSVTVDPIIDDSGIPAGAVHLVSDVTAKRELEEQFRDAQLNRKPIFIGFGPARFRQAVDRPAPGSCRRQRPRR